MIEPQTRDLALVAIILYALADCDPSREAFKNNSGSITARQAMVALEVATTYGPVTSMIEIHGLAQWLKLRRNKIKDVRAVLGEKRSASRECRHCGTWGKWCQLPKSYREDSTIEPGFCIKYHVGNGLNLGLFTYEDYTDWPLIDRNMSYVGIGPYTEPHPPGWYKQRPIQVRDTTRAGGTTVWEPSYQRGPEWEAMLEEIPLTDDD